MKKTLRNDIILIVFLLLVAVGIFIAVNQINKSSSKLVAHIYHGDELIEEIDLSKVIKEEERTYDGDISKVVVVINHNSIKVKESDCPEKICINTGEVTEAGKSITCLPNRIYITITGTGADA